MSETYLVDLSDPQKVYYFPEDFADHLRDLRHDSLAEDFLRKWQMYSARLSEEDLRERGLDHMLTIARMYAPVEDVGRYPDAPFPTAEQIIEEEFWDREAEVAERDVPTERDMNPPECPDVSIEVFVGDTMYHLILRAFFAMVAQGHGEQAEQFRAEALFFLNRSPINREMFRLIWEYIYVHPSREFLEEEEYLQQSA